MSQGRRLEDESRKTSVRYQVLGQLEIRRDEESLELGSFKQRALLALLLIHRNEVLSTDRIIDEIWGDHGTAHRRNALHVYLSNLRKVLEPDRLGRGEGSVLLTRAPGYTIRVDPDEIDSDRFERMVTEGRALVPSDPGSASIVLGEALALWRGFPYEEFTYESFAQSEIIRLNELRLETVEARIDADLARGVSRELVGELESLIREHSLRERLTAQLMIALSRSGRQAEALRAYQRLRSRLGEELGIEPTGELQALEEKIVVGDISLIRSEGVPLIPGDGPPPGIAVRGYELREQLGSGRSGIVYRAFQPAIGREVAVKVIRPEFADDPTFIRRFEDEAQVVARLEHPHIVPLYDYWREPGAGYLVMRLMQGGSLETALASGPLGRERAAKLVAQVGDALGTAHDVGVVHCDLKPASILVDTDGNAYLSDFGIAVAPSDGDSGQAGAITLNPPYASPELRDGKPPSPSSDVYSLAVVAAQMLTGRRGEIAELIVGLDPAIADVLSRATSLDPEIRCRDVASFTEDLLTAMDTDTEVCQPVVREAGNPYKGLRAFQQVDAADFFGRERLVARLVARLGRSGMQGRFVAVVGPSGSGKSSAVKAGVLPALRGDGAPGSAGWYQIEMTPGQDPFSRLEEALVGVAVNPPASLFEELSDRGGIRQAVGRVLPDESSQLVLVIDQLEELYTLSDQAVANRFLAAIVDAVTTDKSRVRVLVTLRADFYDRPLSNRDFGELLRHGTELVTPMSPEEMGRAITAPAERAGVGFEPAVVAEMTSEVAEHPGALPLLQHALTELFEHRGGSKITRAAYREIGGVSGALGDRAETLYKGLPAEARSAVRHIFLRLVALGEGADDARRRVLMSELTSLEPAGHHVAQVVETFGRHRLLSFDRDPVSRGPTVEISHEALLKEWPRLKAWIDRGRSDVRAQRRLAASATEWLERGQNPDFVFTGAHLVSYDGWLESPPVELTADERGFLEAGAAAQRRREDEEREQAHRRAQLRRRSRLLIGLAAVTALVVTLASFAFVQRQRAEELADELAMSERARHLTAESLLHLREDAELAIMLAVEAVRATSEGGVVLPEVLDAIHVSIQSARVQYPVGAEARTAVRGLTGGPTGVFLIPPDDLIAFAQSLVRRSFSPSECDRIFPGEACPDPSAPLPGGLEIEGGERAYLAGNDVASLAGTTVSVTGLWSGPEREAIEATLAAIARRTGIDVNYQTADRDDEGVEVVKSRQATDIVTFPQPGGMAALAREGLLMDLGQYLDTNQLRDSFGDYLVRLTTVASDGTWPAESGGVYGIWVSISAKSLIWHPYPEFEEAGYEIPTDWDEMIELSDRLVADGETPWCLGIESGRATGWPATDWMESIVLRSEGPEFYDRWVNHQIPFDHPAVLDAAQRVVQLAFTEGYVSPGPGAIVNTPFYHSAFLVGEKPPPCWLLPQASFTPGMSQTLSPGENIDVFDFPVIDPHYAQTMVGAGDHAVAITDRPEVRAVMAALASPEFGVEWARMGGHISPNREFDLDNYTKPTERRLAELTLEALEADGFRFDGSDLMPPEIGTDAFWAGMTRLFLEGPEAIEETMADIEATWSVLEESG